MPWLSDHGYVPADINYDDIPRLSSYAEARAHYDSVKPWRGDRWSPLGGRRSTIKRMRMQPDETVVVRFYESDLVHYSADGRVTVTGYRSLATGDFLGRLLPKEIRLHYNDPRPENCEHMVLYLLPDGDERWWETGPGDALVVRCDAPATLRYDGRWVADEVTPFKMPVIDHRAARYVGKQYRLADFAYWLRAAVTLKRIRSQPGGMCWQVADALRAGDFAAALPHVPIGSTVTTFGRTHGGLGRVDPGFTQDLRDWIYEHEGVVTFQSRSTLTLTEHERYRKLAKRFT